MPAPAEERPHNRLAFFGQANPYKGLQVLLGAMSRLHGPRPDIQLTLHAANLELQHEQWREAFHHLLGEAGPTVFNRGAYNHAAVPRLMSEADWVIVPSLWWENSPLVIQEAFLHGRPVICSDVGGMAEKVTDGVNGLHFRIGDPQSLADTILRGVDTPGLWEQLQSGIPPVYSMQEHMASLGGLYEELMRGTARRRLRAERRWEAGRC